MKQTLRSTIRRFGYEIVSLKSLVTPGSLNKPVDPYNLELLFDPSFAASVAEVRGLTLLDTSRLANLWQLCKLANPAGSIIEVGSYKGGSALHLSNSCPNRSIYVCDTWKGFSDLQIDPRLDRRFGRTYFTDTNLKTVQRAWKQKERKVTWVKGYFPESVKDIDIRDISFAHIDVDIYESTLNTLEFLNPRFLERSLIVLDDYLRSADGVLKAVSDFQKLHREWACFPIYPGQALMIHESWFSAGSNVVRTENQTDEAAERIGDPSTAPQAI